MGFQAQTPSRLFWSLVMISMVWTFGFMALRRADLGEFFGEFIRFTIFTGFYWWLLTNGPVIAQSIIESLRELGQQASGVSSITPSSLVDIGFMIAKRAFKDSSIWKMSDSIVGILLSIGILLMLAATALNLLKVLITSWILMYLGVFILGFGGSRWTSDIAINYYKSVIAIGLRLMTMIVLIGIGTDLLDSFYEKMNKGTLNFEELAVMLIACFSLMVLVDKVPEVISSIIMGGSAAAVGGVSGTTAMAMTEIVIATAGMVSAATDLMRSSGGSNPSSLYSSHHQKITEERIAQQQAQYNSSQPPPSFASITNSSGSDDEWGDGDSDKNENKSPFDHLHWS